MLGAAAAVLAVVAIAPLGAARADDPAEPVSTLPADGGPWTNGNRAPSMSANGSVVVFDAATANGPRVTVRDRALDTTDAMPGGDSRNGSLSADGCVVAYSGLRAFDDGGSGYQLLAFNRCAGGVETVVERRDDPDPHPPPAVSANGSILAWSTSDEIVVFALGAGGYAPGPTLEGSGGADELTGEQVDISDNGSIIAFTAGPPSGGGPFQVYVWQGSPANPDPNGTVTVASVGTNGQPVGGASPTISGDGRFVAFERAGAVAVVDRTMTKEIKAFAGASSPELSADGRHLAFNRVGGVFVATWTGDAPFAAVTESLVSTTVDGSDTSAGPSLSRPAISRHGRWVAFDSDHGAELSSDGRFASGTHVWMRERRPALDVPKLDLGTVEVGSTVDGTVTVTNIGPSGVELAPPITAAPFSVIATTCAGVLHPGASCTVSVRFGPATAGVAAGSLIVRGGVPLVEFSGELTGRGAARPISSSATTSTTVPTTSTAPGGDGSSASTTPTFEADSTSVPRTTLPRRRTIPTSPRYTPPRPPTIGTPVIDATSVSVAFDQASVELPAVVAGTGRSTAVVTLSNLGDGLVSVDALSISPEAGFDVDATTCDAAIAPGSSCEVTIEFRSGVVGTFTASLIATTTTAATATVQLLGTAVDPPTLHVEPEVAASGQVVTVVGAGFPAGATLELFWGTDPRPRSVTADDTGGFRAPLVVMTHTPNGPLVVRVPGETDRFPETEAELLVSSTGARPTTAVLGALNPVG